MSEVNYQSFGDTSMLKGDTLAKAEALAESALPADGGTRDVEVKQDLTTEPVVEDQGQKVQSQEASQGSVLEVPEDTLVRVKIDGQIQEVPYKEFRDSLQREAAWHQRQQKLAQGKKQLEEYYAQQFAELEKNARVVAAYEQELKSRLFGQQAQPQQPNVQANKDEIATLSEVRQEAERVGQTIEEKIAARDRQLESKLLTVAQQLRQEQITKQNALKFEQGLGKILTSKDYKALEVIPNLEQNLRYEVAQLQPESIEEAIEFADKIAKDWATRLKGIHITEQQKADAQKAKAKLEPSDGSPIQMKNSSKPKSFLGKDGKLNHAALREAAMSLLD